jgi:hypothetical protein
MHECNERVDLSICRYGDDNICKVINQEINLTYDYKNKELVVLRTYGQG